jgi:adenylate cyclase
VSATRRLAAILAADVVGYSSLMGRDEAGTARAVRENREAAAPIVRGFGGRVVKTMGDGVLLEFPSVVAAVECAITIQQQMAKRGAGVPDAKRILYRIGVNLGDVLIEGEDILGDGVNIAARLEGICAPGGVCISGSAHDHVRGRIDTEFVDLGERTLKNIAQPVRVYALGVGEIARANPAEPATPVAPTPQKRRFGLAPLTAALAALLIAIASGAWWFFNANQPASVATKAPAEAARLSIVVMPFANLSGDPGQDYLVDALTDELTTSLARLHDTFVIARNTATTFKGKPVDVKAIGKDLGVRYVLEGSVQPSGDRMRVNAQLIDAGSGAHIWAEQFDTPRADLLQTQDAIVTHLTRALDFQLYQAEAARLKRTPAADPNAEDLALRCAAGAWRAGWIGKEADAAYALCEQALAIDPNNVRALRILGLKFLNLAQSGTSSDSKGDLERADELESKALALDPDSTWTHVYKGDILRLQARYQEAVAEHERALDLDPSNVCAAANLGFDYLNFGEFDKSFEYFDKAIRASPSDSGLAYWKRTRRCSATSRCPPPGRSRRSRHGRPTSPRRAAVRPASRRTSGYTKACARRECRRSERRPPPRRDPCRRRRRLQPARETRPLRERGPRFPPCLPSPSGSPSLERRLGRLELRRDVAAEIDVAGVQRHDRGALGKVELAEIGPDHIRGGGQLEKVALRREIADGSIFRVEGRAVDRRAERDRHVADQPEHAGDAGPLRRRLGQHGQEIGRQLEPVAGVHVAGNRSFHGRIGEVLAAQELKLLVVFGRVGHDAEFPPVMHDELAAEIFEDGRVA